MTILLILLGIFIILLIYDHGVTRTIKRDGCIDWKTRGNKIWWEWNTKGWLNFEKKCREARRYRNGVRKHW